MKHFLLTFSNDKMEKEYWSLVKKSTLETFMVTVIFWAFYLISYAASGHLHVEIIIALGFLGSIVILGVFLRSIRKLDKYCEYVGILLTAGLGASVLYSVVQHIDSASKYLTFLRGWSFACVEIMLINQFSRFSLKIVAALISFGLRFGCIGHEDPKIFTGDILLRNILFEVLLIYIFYKFEKKERNLFAKLYELQEEMRQIKSLLGQNFRRESLAIIDFRNKILFCNNKYGELMRNQGVKNSFVFTMGNKIMIDPDSLKLKNHTTLGAFDEVLTLNEFIQNLICNQFYGSQTWLVSGSCEIEGECRDFEITISSIVWEKIPSIAIVLDDDDLHKKEIMTLKQANENKDLLIATVSHELRTPLHGILGLIQVVESKTKEEGILEHLSLCKDNANLLLNLVNSLLDLQQIQHGEVKLNPSQVHLHSLVYSITRLFSFLAHEKNVELCVTIEENVPQYIITDEGRLKQILINLVSNALKFTFSGNITICVSEDLENSDHLKFSVLDTGIGIKKEQQSKLFQLYTKLDDTEGMNKNGVGLGLTICNSLAKLLSDIGNKNPNRIVVKSEYGFGSSFSFSIHKNLSMIIINHEKTTHKEERENISDFEEFSKPMNIKAKLSLYSSLKNTSLKGLSVSKLSTFYEKKNYVTTVDELSGLSPQGPNKYNNITSINMMKLGKSEAHFESPKGTILVVDDNSLNLLIARNFLESEGYQVQTALNGQQAIEKVEIMAKETGAFSCILMDGQMPIMDGYEATRILKKMMENGKVNWTPIIALTASNDEKTIKKCFEYGMDEYLCKPLVKGDLFRMLLKFEGAVVTTTVKDE